VLLLLASAIWGCIPELTRNCIDMTNASSAYLGILVGAGFAAILSWWIYNREKKTSTQQDYILQRVRELEEKNTQVLIKLYNFAEQNNQLLNKLIAIDESIFELDKKIQSVIENDRD
jgi:type II secretory pathway component PulF